jgi:Spherulation-specific family 4
VGYVRTTYATRNISDVFDDVSVYSSWATNKTGEYGMHGIFFDEVPNTYTDSGAEFMREVDAFARKQTGLGTNYVSPP